MTDTVERESELLLTKRHDHRDGDALLEPSYAESVRRYHTRLAAAYREEWARYHREQAERHRRTLEQLIAEHEAAIAELAQEEASA